MSGKKKKILIGKYKEDLFSIYESSFKDNGMIEINTSNGRKAEKYNMKPITREGYEPLIVTVSEVEIICDRDEYRKTLFELDPRFKDYLLSIEWSPRPSNEVVSSELRKEFEKYGIKLKHSAIIEANHSSAWDILESNINRYTITIEYTKIVVRNTAWL